MAIQRVKVDLNLIILLVSPFPSFPKDPEAATWGSVYNRLIYFLLMRNIKLSFQLSEELCFTDIPQLSVDDQVQLPITNEEVAWKYYTSSSLSSKNDRRVSLPG